MKIKPKVLILTDGRTARLGAGNWVQAYETSRAMKALGFNLTHMIYNLEDKNIPNGVGVVEDDFDYDKFDVIHFIPVSSVSDKLIKKVCESPNRPLLVASTIYWDSKIHRKVSAQNSNRSLWLLRYWFRKYIPWLSRSWNKFEYFDVLLPNSDMEKSVLYNNFKIKKGAVIMPIPNAVCKMPHRIHDLEPIEELQGKEYILYPGVFSPRKNQLGFIRAMRDVEYKIVFMGGALETEESKKYYEKCIKEANPDWIFLGNVEHKSKRFYQVIKNARVACLASSCETPGIALLEALALGVRVAVTYEGSTREYFGFEATYCDPLSKDSIRKAIQLAWNRDHLSSQFIDYIKINYSWEKAALRSLDAYKQALARI